MRYIKIHGEEVVDTIVDDISLQQRNDIDKKLKSEMVDRIRTKGFSFTILGDDRYTPSEAKNLCIYHLYFDENIISLGDIILSYKPVGEWAHRRTYPLKDALNKLSKLHRQINLSKLEI